jgi:hypothetical protein
MRPFAGGAFSVGIDSGDIGRPQFPQRRAPVIGIVGIGGASTARLRDRRAVARRRVSTDTAKEVLQRCCSQIRMPLTNLVLTVEGPDALPHTSVGAA